MIHNITIPALSWADTSKRSDFSFEFQYATDVDLDIRQKAQPAFLWLHQKKAEGLLYGALDRFAPLLPIVGLEGKPTLWYSPPPSGADNRVGIIVAEDSGGVVRLVGSNWISALEPTVTPVPHDIIGRFHRASNDFDRNEIIVDALNSVATSGWVENIRRVDREARRYRTMPIYLAVISAAGTWFYCTTAIIEDRHQANFDLEFVGEVPHRSACGMPS